MNNKIIPSALIFGNESTGLPKNIYENKDTVTIKHSSNIDSLNVSISVAIALYEFYK
jgi:tRNA G18 (ribose-2'-O)-methylase SpoU